MRDEFIAIECKRLINVLRSRGVTTKEIREIEALSDGDKSRFRRLLERKRFGEPNAYLRGWFSAFSKKFVIDRRVYIPDQNILPVIWSRIIFMPPAFGIWFVER